jgi:type II secretory pathway component PulK
MNNQKGMVLLIVLFLVSILTMLINSSVSLLTIQHQININEQVNFMAKIDCRNAIYSARLALMNNQETTNLNNLNLMPDVNSVALTVARISSNSSDTFRTYQINSICTSNMGNVLSRQQASITLNHPIQTTLPTIDLKHL